MGLGGRRRVPARLGESLGGVQQGAEAGRQGVGRLRRHEPPALVPLHETLGPPGVGDDDGRPGGQAVVELAGGVGRQDGPIGERDEREVGYREEGQRVGVRQRVEQANVIVRACRLPDGGLVVAVPGEPEEDVGPVRQPPGGVEQGRDGVGPAQGAGVEHEEPAVQGVLLAQAGRLGVREGVDPLEVGAVRQGRDGGGGGPGADVLRHVGGDRHHVGGVPVEGGLQAVQRVRQQGPVQRAHLEGEGRPEVLYLEDPRDVAKPPHEGRRRRDREGRRGPDNQVGPRHAEAVRDGPAGVVREGPHPGDRAHGIVVRYVEPHQPGALRHPRHPVREALLLPCLRRHDSNVVVPRQPLYEGVGPGRRRAVRGVVVLQEDGDGHESGAAGGAGSGVIETWMRYRVPSCST